MEEYIPFIIAGAVVIAVVLWVVFTKYLRGSKIQAKRKVNVDVEKIITALGGRENIISTRAVGSRLSVELSDDNKLNSEALKELGASGIVQTSNKVTVILGKVSQLVAEEMNK